MAGDGEVEREADERGGLTLGADALQLLVGLESQVPGIYKRNLPPLKTHYGFTDHEVEFFAIHIEADESPWPDREKYPAKFDIDELRCIYCGMCEEACPVDAIELTSVYDIVGLTR